MTAVHAVATPLGSYFREVNTTPLLDAAEERELADRIQEGDREARDHLVRANLRYVARVARGFTGRGLCIQELIQEGNLGLMRAVEAFDPAMNTRFTTYATYWITQSIQRALDNMAMSVRVPAYAADLAANWRRTAAQLRDELDRIPSEEEVAERMKLPPRKLRIVQKALRIFNGPAHVEKEGKSLSDVVADPTDSDPGAALAQTDEMHKVIALLGGMDPREASILRLRFGLTGEDPMTLSEIGERLSLTRERVRQLERDALKKLRNQVGGDEAV
jgi:RNA polymerase primary sigma factor